MKQCKTVVEGVESPATAEDQHVDTKGAATFLGMSPQVICEWRTKGVGPVYRKFGRSVRYRMDDLRAWAASRATSSTSSAPSM